MPFDVFLPLHVIFLQQLSRNVKESVYFSDRQFLNKPANERSVLLRISFSIPTRK